MQKPKGRAPNKGHGPKESFIMKNPQGIRLKIFAHDIDFIVKLCFLRDKLLGNNPS